MFVICTYVHAKRKEKKDKESWICCTCGYMAMYPLSMVHGSLKALSYIYIYASLMVQSSFWFLVPYNKTKQS
ncbi:hypothetical protein F5050DRAFT_1726377 [Lentinula boryana]|uniref:Uncharacterized protein n=1 Tax=Lentinula boryana TaxID=40481 RepID=A0ABQ8QRU1_9AGAR|nr:hypothetical protein F5050DRAFT_1726377 [Lentinula boryana]